MSGKTKKENQNDIWGTPPEIFDPINTVFNFTLDVCANSKNTKTKRFYNFEQNALKQPWDKRAGTANWANIPFSQKSVWFKKAHEEAKQGAVIALMTTMDSLTNKAFQENRECVSHIFIFNGRIKFIGKTKDTTFNQGNALVIYNGHKVPNLNELHSAFHEKNQEPLGMLFNYSQSSSSTQEVGQVIPFPKVGLENNPKVTILVTIKNKKVG